MNRSALSLELVSLVQKIVWLCVCTIWFPRNPRSKRVFRQILLASNEENERALVLPIVVVSTLVSRRTGMDVSKSNGFVWSRFIFNCTLSNLNQNFRYYCHITNMLLFLLDYFACNTIRNEHSALIFRVILHKKMKLNEIKYSRWNCWWVQWQGIHCKLIYFCLFPFENNKRWKQNKMLNWNGKEYGLRHLTYFLHLNMYLSST